VAGALLHLAEDQAVAAGSIAAYLHVISYNQPAIEFYLRQGFEEVRHRKKWPRVLLCCPSLYTRIGHLSIYQLNACH
jgi:ribosomal protein S18 acetylase RimI-like enzyme